MNKNEYTIRPVRIDEIDLLSDLFANARRRMKEAGNPGQWQEDRPALSTLQNDIEKGQLFAVESYGELQGVFALIGGDDPTYARIDDGKWLNDEPYCVIHRIARTENGHGIFDAALARAASLYGNLRIDTHQDNAVMQHLLRKHGFSYCGIIYTDDGTSRMAFQKVLHE